MQLIAVSAHWATVSVSIAELESRGEIPLDKIPDEDYHEYSLEYDLWRAEERFCYSGLVEVEVQGWGGSTTTEMRQRTRCNHITSAIEGRGGGAEDESCRGRGEECEDHFAATSTARATTYVALICAAIVGFPLLLGVLVVLVRKCCYALGPESSRPVAGSSTASQMSGKRGFLERLTSGAVAVLFVGGVVGFAGAVNYSDTLLDDYKPTNYDVICGLGCELSLSGGVLAIVGAIGIAVAVTKQPQTSEKLSDSVETPPTPPPETEPEPKAEEMGFMGKLAWYLFGEEEPAAESEGVVVEAEAMGEQGELAPEV
jgi:hypothetical protein